LLSVGRRAARFRQVRSSRVTKVPPISVEKEDGAQHPVAVSFDQAGDAPEDSVKGSTEENRIFTTMGIEIC
jgi:hypothetical protein